MANVDRDHPQHFRNSTVLVGVVGALLTSLACGDSTDSNVPPFGGELPPASSVSAPPSTPVTAAPGVTPTDTAPAAPVGTPSTGEMVGTPALDPGAAPATPAPGAAPSEPAAAEGEVTPEPALPPPPEGGTPVDRHGQLHVDGTRLVDESGATVQLKGVSTMWLNWEDRYSTSRTGLAWMRDNWNVTVVRAAMGVEPDGAYLTDPEAATTQLRKVVQNAIDVGVYVLIDWHDHDATAHQNQAVAFFTQMAREFGSYPNVIYEPFNEPLNIDWSTQIKPYHEAVLRAIRAEDPDNVAVLGTRSWSQRVDQAAADRVQGTNLMYTVHFYACDHRDFQRNEAQVAYDMGLPLFVTEWGATPADGGSATPRVCEADAQVWHDWLDERNISWAAWKLDGCRDSSCFFANRDVSPDGGWADNILNGHGRFVVTRLRD